jgi:hypothetical protein
MAFSMYKPNHFNMSETLDAQRNQQIKTLLLSETVDNTALAVEKISEGSINKILLSYLTAIHLKHIDAQVRARARQLFQQHAPPALQNHINQHWHHHLQDDWYFHHPVVYEQSDISFFDAVLAEKMVFWHSNRTITHSEHLNIRMRDQTWGIHHQRMSEIPFITTIVIHQVEQFDFQQFMQATAQFKLNYLHFSRVPYFPHPADMETLWQLPHLKMLLFDSWNPDKRMTIPKILNAPLYMLSIRNYAVNGLENLAPYIKQFSHLLVE